MISESMDLREARFLRKVEQSVFGYPGSPYAKLFRNAGCEFGDVRRLVRRDGLEEALWDLYKAGVHVTWEELKGRAPATRGSQTFYFRESEFDNPLIETHYQSSSSGTTGTPVRTRLDLADFTQSAANWAVWFQAHDWMDRPLIFWTPMHTGMANRYLRCAKFGKSYTKWFVTTNAAPFRDRFRSSLVHGLTRLVAGFPKPELVSVNRADSIGEYLIDLLQTGEKPLVNTTPSCAALVSMVMRQRGESLAGVAFLLGAEPVTCARRKAIEDSGAQAVATYGTSECGWIGTQFPGEGTADGVHVFLDAFAIVTRSGPPATTGVNDVLLFTGLRPAGPKVLINTDIGDSGITNIDRGGYPAEQFGYDLRIHTIRSFRKLTAWGVTFAHSDLYRIVEECLPNRFGGGVTNYQLVEDQDEQGLPVLSLFVSSSIGEISEAELRAVFFRELSRLKNYYGFMTDVIRQAEAFRIERRDPVVTRSGKLIPIVTYRGS